MLTNFELGFYAGMFYMGIILVGALIFALTKERRQRNG